MDLVNYFLGKDTNKKTQTARTIQQSSNSSTTTSTTTTITSTSTHSTTTTAPNQTKKKDRKSSIPQVPKTRLNAAERLKFMVQEISKENLDLTKIRHLSFEGLPDGELRAMYWRVLLNYLPPDRSQWNSVLTAQRKLYYELVAELRSKPQKKNEEVCENVSESATDHPLSQAKSSTWNEFFKENDIINQIEKDVHRTFPHLHFFQIEEMADDDQAVSIPLTNHHSRALRSILFLYAKLNSGISYVQGMNEIVGPIYYVFATDTNEAFSEHAEPDAFFCFTNLMGEIKDNFVKTLDQSKVGIRQKMTHLNEMLKQKDFELWENLEKKQLSPEFYTFRWLTLLLSQEFELPDVLRLWDSLFSDEDRFQYLLYVCLAMLIQLKPQLITMDFAESLKLLQTYPPTNIYTILELANQISSSSYGCIPTGDSNYDYSEYFRKAQTLFSEFVNEKIM